MIIKITIKLSRKKINKVKWIINKINNENNINWNQKRYLSIKIIFKLLLQNFIL